MRSNQSANAIPLWFDFRHVPLVTNMENYHLTTDASEPIFDFCMDHENSNQLLTPPESQQGDEHGDQDNVSVSTTFFPGAHVFGSASDLILVPSDSVYFYVHSHVLLSASGNGFNSMLPILAPENRDYFGPGAILAVPEGSHVLNIVLHAIYDLSCTQYSPSFDTLVEAVSTLTTYGIAPKNVITPSTPLYDILLTHATIRPLDLYALASQNDLYDLAVATSSYLLSFSLSAISDEIAERIGPLYLKRLFFLHLGRAEVLRNILLPPPYPHPPTSVCGYSQQKKIDKCVDVSFGLPSMGCAGGPFNQCNGSCPYSVARSFIMRPLSNSTERAHRSVDHAMVHNQEDDLKLTIASIIVHIYVQNSGFIAITVVSNELLSLNHAFPALRFTSPFIVSLHISHMLVLNPAHRPLLTPCCNRPCQHVST